MTDGPGTRRDGAPPATDQRQTDLRRVEEKWQRVWDELDVFRAKDDGSAPRRYLLTMFPYPSGDLHMGHAEVFALEDVVARYWRLRGFDVLNPIGWDSFGLPAENAAIRRGENPAVFTYANIETQAASIRRYGVSFDWSRRLHTSDPEYYRWTQWLFLRMRELGLAYRATSPVNWCPRDQTVLANEQVVQGACERCGAAVTKRELTQWFFKVTDYADKLLDDMDLLAGAWPERVLTMQRNWIGRSAGASVRFAVAQDRREAAVPDRPGEDHAEPVTVFTTRPDTLYGVTFIAVAPDAPLAAELCAPERRGELDAYLELVRRETDVDRLATGRRKTGVFLGTHVVNPATGRQVPVWAADYVLADHGTGAIMGVPGQDRRDWDFATAHGLPVVRTVASPEGFDGEAYPGPGVVVNSSGPGPALDGLRTEDAADAVVAWLESTGAGERAVTYRLRDWLVSRQRYWGCPIPMVHCPACGEVPVPDEELPVRLPDLRGADLAPRGSSPLAAATDWVTTACPSCGGEARRDTDTMDTFVDSSWYFLRYCSPGHDDGPFDPQAVRRWMPVARYVGGVEHAILHLLYSRFVTKVLHDLGLLDVVEPFASLLNQGQVINRGRAMSKSLGNGVELGAQLDAYGVDAVRLTMVFAGPPEDDVDWADLSPGSAVRFLQRALRLADDVESSPGVDVASGDPGLRRVTHRTVRETAELVESSRFNVMVARVMELVNTARRAVDSGCGAADPAVREAAEVVAVILGLVAPYTAEEMWQKLGHRPSVATAGWPEMDASLLTEETVVAVVQVDGRLRAKLTVPAGVDAEALREAALAEPAVLRAVDGRPVQRVVVRAPRLVNVVTG